MKYNLNQLIKEVLSNHNIKSKCNCGCNTCKNVGNPGPILNESINHNFKLSKNLKSLFLVKVFKINMKYIKAISLFSIRKKN